MNSKSKAKSNDEGTREKEGERQRVCEEVHLLTKSEEGRKHERKGKQVVCQQNPPHLSPSLYSASFSLLLSLPLPRVTDPLLDKHDRRKQWRVAQKSERKERKMLIMMPSPVDC